MALHSSVLAWRILWTEEPGGLQSKGSQRIGHSWVSNTFTFQHYFRGQYHLESTLWPHHSWKNLLKVKQISLKVKAKQSRWFGKFCTEILIGNSNVSESDMLWKLQWHTRIVLHWTKYAIFKIAFSSADIIFRGALSVHRNDISVLWSVAPITFL